MSTCPPTPPQTADEAIAAAVATPERMSGDQGSIDQRSIPDLIAAAKFQGAQAAAKSKGFGIRFARVENGGTA
jgi:hypothetical protein